MRIAVLGASGMLGSMLVDYLSKDYKVIATVRDTKYIRHIDNVTWKHLDAMEPQLEVVKDCEWVINAIGIIPQITSTTAEMDQINGEFPYLLAYKANTVIHITTDCVFSGKDSNYTEISKHDSTSAYGISKSNGEVFKENVINLRTSIVGPEPHGSYSLLGWFLSQPQGATIDGYVNHLWNGITTLHLAKICKAIIDKDLRLPNLLHIVPDNYCSKYWLLNLFKEYFNRDDITINRKETDAVDRRLATIYPKLNKELWKLAGYSAPPIIDKLIKELSDYGK